MWKYKEKLYVQSHFRKKLKKKDLSHFGMFSSSAFSRNMKMFKKFCLFVLPRCYML